ncbi:hypothetical protein [Salegentibacter chungangensis]|uniref:SH3 domain-containing protein n=1 Tax=Salegentibacter chungangensis TaxID=1335724 RepID=A0ABW3NSW5_9FLAO
MRRVLFLIFVFGSQLIFAQKQEEVIANNSKLIVYENANKNSKPIDTILRDEAFLITENHQNISEWILVDIPENNLNRDESFKNGYVQKSQIKNISSLPVYKENDIGLIFKIKKIDTKKSLEKGNSGYGLEIQLTDSFETEEMILKWNENRQVIDAKYYNDIFNLDFKEGKISSENNDKFKIYKRGNTYFINQKCGDGAGFYEITWIIQKGRIIQRLIDTI